MLLAGRELRGTTPIRARQELWAALIVYQAIRLLICQAALTQQVAPARISFTAALTAAQHAITTTPADTPKHLEWICQDLCQQLITRHTHYRIFPRARKNTLSRYPYRGQTGQLTSAKASCQAQIITPADTQPTPGSPATPAQPRAA